MAAPIGSSSTGPSLFDRAIDLKNKAVEFHEEHEEQFEKGWETREVISLAGDAFQSAKDLKEGGFNEAWGKAREELIEGAKDPSAPLNLGHKIKILGGAGQALAGLYRLPETVHDIKDAIGTLLPGNEKNATESMEARHEGIRGVKDLAWTAQAGFDTATTAQKLVKTYKAATTAFAEAAPTASKAVQKAAAKAATKEAFKVTAKEAGEEAVIHGAKKAVTESVAKSAEKIAVKTGEKVIAETALKAGGEAAAKAALKAGAHAAESTLARAAGRLAPGVNVAIAALDVADAYNTLKNPDAGTGKKVASVVTAVGSVLAATNIPVVSQIGAGISIVSGFIGSFLK